MGAAAQDQKTRWRKGRRRRLALPLAVATLAAPFAPAELASAVPAQTPTAAWVTDGRVNSIVESGGTVYLGGSFSLVGPPTGHAVVTDGNGAVLAASGINGPVYAAAPDGAGGWYVGGDFSAMGSSTQINAAHLNPDGTLDTRWSPRPGSPVRAIAVDTASARVYLGGDFDTIRGLAAPWLAAVDAKSGGLLSSFTPGLDGTVRALALNGGDLLVGGDFAHAGGATASRLVRLDATSGARAATQPVAPNGSVHAITVDTSSGRAYVGGDFTAMGATARGRGAAVDLSTMALSSFDPRLDAGVDSLAVANGRVYAGGRFRTAAGTGAPLLAALDPSSGAPVSGFTPGVGTVCRPPSPDTTCTPTVSALVTDGTVLYVGGWFTTVGGSVRNNAAAVDATTGALRSWDPEANGAVATVSASGGAVLVGGDLTSANAARRSNAAALDASTGRLVDTWAPEPDGTVYAVEASADGSRIYLGGTFKQAGGARRTNLAAVSTTSGAAVSSFSVKASSAVYALDRSGSRLYVGGNFSSLGPVTVGRIGAIDEASATVDPSFHPSANAKVMALAVSPDGTRLWAGGYFTSVGGRTAANVAPLNATTGQAIAWTPSLVPKATLAVATDGTMVCAGTAKSGTGGNSTICWSATTGATRLAVSGNGNVQAVAIANGTVYAGGHFSSLRVGSTTVIRRKLAAFDLATGALLSWAPTVNSALGVFALAPQSDHLWAGGDFTAVDGQPQQGIALMPGTP